VKPVYKVYIYVILDITWVLL